MRDCDRQGSCRCCHVAARFRPAATVHAKLASWHGGAPLIRRVRLGDNHDSRSRNVREDLDRMVSFYTKTFGLIVDEAQRGDYAVLTGPEVELSIVQIPEHIASQIEISSPSPARSRHRLSWRLFFH